MRTLWQVTMDPGLGRPKRVVKDELTHEEAVAMARTMQRDRHLYYKRLTVEPEGGNIIVGAWETAAGGAR